jgi:hypothetical protein
MQWDLEQQASCRKDPPNKTARGMPVATGCQRQGAANSRINRPPMPASFSKGFDAVRTLPGIVVHIERKSPI